MLTRLSFQERLEKFLHDTDNKNWKRAIVKIRNSSAVSYRELITKILPNDPDSIAFQAEQLSLQSKIKNMKPITKSKILRDFGAVEVRNAEL